MNRRPITIENVLELEEYTSIYLELEGIRASNQFVTRPDVDDEGIDTHPLWTESLPSAIQEKMIAVLKFHKIDEMFGFDDNQPLILSSHISKSFVLVYLPTQRDRSTGALTFSLHKDVAGGENDGKHILSVVYTMKSSDCIGGALGVSHRPDGEAFRTSDMTTISTKDNSLYCFNGSYAAHCAYGISRGVRFAVVLFIVTPQTTRDVVALWNSVEPPQEICLNCYRVLNTRKQFIDHIRYICPKCKICCNTSYSSKKHVCNRSK
jgi:hypothetical protein